MRLAYITLLACILTVAGCGKDGGDTKSGTLQVAATIYPLKDIIQNVGGEKVSVIAIMTPGASPHTFDVGPETIRQAQGIKALFKIGAGLDDWSDRVTASVENVTVFEVSKNVPLRKLDDGSTDPHYWLAIKNAMIITDNVAEALSSLDPANKDYYASNAAAYKQKLAAADEQIKERLSGLSEKQFATFHEAWFYFANAYGLKVVAAFEPFPGKEPTPDFLAHFIRTIKESKVRVIFAEPQFSPESIKQVADDLGVYVGTLDPEGGATPQTMTYIGMMQYNADKIYEAMK